MTNQELFNRLNVRFDAIDARLDAQDARIDRIEKGTPAPACKKGTRKGAPKDFVYIRKDGTEKKCTQKEYDFFMKGKARAEARANRTEEEKAAAKAKAQAQADAFAKAWEQTAADRLATRPKGVTKSEWNKTYAAKLREQMKK